MTPAERFAAARGGLAVGPPEARAFLRAHGADALDFLHRTSTQALGALLPGASAYAAFLTARGHLLGEGMVLRRAGDVLLSLDPGAGEATRAHLERLVIMDDVSFEDLSPALRALPVFGPGAAGRLEAIGGRFDAVVTARRGAPCVELWLPTDEAEASRAALVGAGAVPLDASDLEALRIAAGIPRWGADVDGDRLPMEAGLTREAISFSKGCYPGQEIVMRATARGHLKVGLVLLELPPGVAVGAPLAHGGQAVGAVTSVAETPEGRLGLAYLRRTAWTEGTRLATQDGGEAVVRRRIAWEPEG